VVIRCAVGFGRFLDPLADFAAVDDDVVGEVDPIVQTIFGRI
jgi:hypothetical protein